MSKKQKKKRDKTYTGSGAALTKPKVTRITAVNRSALGQWRHDHDRMIKTVAKVAMVVLSILLIITGIITIASGKF